MITSAHALARHPLAPRAHTPVDERSWRHNGNIAKWIQHQQIGITGHDYIGAAVYREFKKLVILRITAHAAMRSVTDTNSARAINSNNHARAAGAIARARYGRSITSIGSVSVERDLSSTLCCAARYTAMLGTVCALIAALMKTSVSITTLIRDAERLPVASVKAGVDS